MSLIELLVALVVLTIVLTLAYGSFTQVSTGITGVEQALSDQQELRLLLTLITDDLSCARYLSQWAAGNHTSGIIARMGFVGHDDFTRIDFHAATPARFHRERPLELDPELHEVGYAVQERPGGTLALVRREDYYLTPDLQNGGISVDLVQNVTAFKVEFLAPMAPGQSQENWLTEWDSNRQPAPARMPAAMRVTLAVQGKTGRPLSESLELNLQTITPVKP
ncbi:MAG TPA: type II secretion system protein GspJ [bacterium]|nr:type II secretion system protein GspJ [bacterium]